MFVNRLVLLRVSFCFNTGVNAASVWGGGQNGEERLLAIPICLSEDALSKASQTRPGQTSQESPMYSCGEGFGGASHPLTVRLQSLAVLACPRITGGELTICDSVPAHTTLHTLLQSRTHMAFLANIHTTTSNTRSLTNVPLRSGLPLPCVATPGDCPVLLSPRVPHSIYSLHPPPPTFPATPQRLELSFDGTAGDEPHRSTGAHTDEAGLSRPQEARTLIKWCLIRIH